jgi:hypothetical protein
VPIRIHNDSGKAVFMDALGEPLRERVTSWSLRAGHDAHELRSRGMHPGRPHTPCEGLDIVTE